MTKIIHLTQGKDAIVDDEDFERLNQYNWYALKNGNTWYARRKIGKFPNQGTVQMHREITNASNDMQVDHIDGNGVNNTRSNLRICTKAQNSLNRKKPSNNTSGYKGVTCHGKGWQAQISAGGKHIYLGVFEDIKDAVAAYDSAAIKHHGDFANTNSGKR